MLTRLQQQLDFLYEIDKLKTVFRRTNLIAEPKRLENSTEHSWHLAMYTMVLSEYANEDINILRVLKMVLLHDLVEIDAGDTFCFDTQANVDKELKETQAAQRIFNILPESQKNEFLSLWEEFEAGETADAKFAIAMDQLQPFLHNYKTDGGTWKRYNIVSSQVKEQMAPVMDGSSTLAELMESLLQDAINKKILY